MQKIIILVGIILILILLLNFNKSGFGEDIILGGPQKPENTKYQYFTWYYVIKITNKHSTDVNINFTSDVYNSADFKNKITTKKLKKNRSIFLYVKYNFDTNYSYDVSGTLLAVTKSKRRTNSFKLSTKDGFNYKIVKQDSRRVKMDFNIDSRTKVITDDVSIAPKFENIITNYGDVSRIKVNNQAVSNNPNIIFNSIHDFMIKRGTSLVLYTTGNTPYSINVDYGDKQFIIDPKIHRYALRSNVGYKPSVVPE